MAWGPFWPMMKFAVAGLVICGAAGFGATEYLMTTDPSSSTGDW